MEPAAGVVLMRWQAPGRRAVGWAAVRARDVGKRTAGLAAGVAFEVVPWDALPVFGADASVQRGAAAALRNPARPAFPLGVTRNGRWRPGRPARAAGDDAGELGRAHCERAAFDVTW